LKRKHRGYGDIFYIDEVFVKINGKKHYLWRAVDQDGKVIDVYLQAKRDGAAAIQVAKAGSAIRDRACCSPKSIQSWAPPPNGLAPIRAHTFEAHNIGAT
jgi:hypothetical protein